MDGCAENVFILDTILKYHQQAHKSLYMASIDVAKAFDSVSHAALLQTLKIKGLPAPMLRYVKSIYENSYTKLRCAGWSSNAIWPTQGVKQGDPLSPIMFILTIDRMLSKLPQDIGCTVGETRVNSIAFADDIILFASTAQGLQRLLDVAAGF
jgi:Reverse transcriptase (RNA-dependent DNA polymerase).